MSIDRGFIHLNKTKKDWGKMENSTNKWKDKPSKMARFNKTSIIKLLIPALLMSWWGISVIKNAKSASLTKSKNKKIELVSDENNILMDEQPTDAWFDIGLAAIMPSKASYKPAIEHELNNSMLIFDNGEYTKNDISGISLDEELGIAPWTHVAQTIKEDLYLSMFRRLSDEDYQDMFKWFNTMRQWTLGDCYLIAAIKNLARSKYFNTLMKSSIERTGDDSFILYMPLWEPNWVKVKITSEDLKAAHLRGAIWYQILEVWFSKYLLFKEWVISSTNGIITDKLIKKIEAWSAWDAMLTLLWPKSFSNIRLTWDPKNKLTILKYLESYDPKNLWSISISSKFKEWKTDKKFYEVWWEPIYYGHAYSICGIEKDWDLIKYVILDNPHNDPKKPWWRKVKLKISDFFDCFSFINISHPTDNFLNFITFPDEVKVVDAIDRKKS